MQQLRSLTGKLAAVRLAAPRIRLWMTATYNYQTEKGKYCPRFKAASYQLYHIPSAPFTLPAPTTEFHVDTGEYAIMDSKASSQIIWKGATSKPDLVRIMREMYATADNSEYVILPPHVESRIVKKFQGFPILPSMDL